MSDISNDEVVTTATDTTVYEESISPEDADIAVDASEAKVVSEEDTLKEAKILVAVPCQEMVNVNFVVSLLQLQRPAGSNITFTQSSILPQSRDSLANIAIMNGFTHILFIDSDMTFPRDALFKLFQHNVDICTALCFARKGDHNPCVYKRFNWENPVKGKHNGNIDPEDDIERDFFEVQACGMAFCLIKTDVLVKLKEQNDGELFKYIATFGEDLSFCARAKKAGYKIWCDGTIPIGHVGEQIVGKREYYLAKQIKEARERAIKEAEEKKKSEEELANNTDSNVAIDNNSVEEIADNTTPVNVNSADINKES